MKDSTKMVLIIVVFIIFFGVDFHGYQMHRLVGEPILLLQEYIREHTLTCLIPALFIAGAIASFISQGAVIKYFGAGAKKVPAYLIASVSGAVLAVCSCTILPLFAGIYKRGAGIGPATAFVYSGPAINVLAIILTAKVIGFEMGVARAVGAVLFSVIIGVIMAVLFRNSENSAPAQAHVNNPEESSGFKKIIFFLAMMLMLISATWYKPEDKEIWTYVVYSYKWWLTGFFFISTLVMTFSFFSKDERVTWMSETFSYSTQMIPLLFIGVLAAGFLLGRPNGEGGIIPQHYIESLVGGNGFGSTFFASVAGAFMYFATLTEIPILQGLMGAGMGKGPALALLLAGPALSLPNMLVIRSIIGTKKTVVYVLLVIVMSTAAGLIYGNTNIGGML